MPKNLDGRVNGPLGVPQTDAEKAARQVSSAMDSVNLVNKLIEENSRKESDLDTIRRNVQHLEIVVEREVVKNSSEDLAPLHAAIASGGSYLAAPAS